LGLGRASVTPDSQGHRAARATSRCATSPAPSAA